MKIWNLGDLCSIKARDNGNGTFTIAHIASLAHHSGYDKWIDGKVHAITGDTMFPYIIELDPLSYSKLPQHATTTASQAGGQYKFNVGMKYSYAHGDCLAERLIGTQSSIAKIDTSIVITCTGCGDGAPMAVPNCKDGKTFVCWSCKKSYGWKYNSILI